MTMRHCPSPNHDARPADGAVDMVVLHYTGMADAAAALARLCDPAAKVSTHYLIDEDGGVYRLVAEARRAWHAGIASWRRATDINARSIGIELVNPGHDGGRRPFPAPQMMALLDLLRDIGGRYAIPRDRILGHSDVAPLRKQDPGEWFDWALLAGHGFGLWPEPDFAPSEHAPALAPGQAGPAILNLQIALDAIGYGIEGTALYDPVTEAVVTAFQRHFRARLVDGVADPETTSLIHHLADRAG
jgi:N-acetylmuramoyl-L-alanine amidase